MIISEKPATTEIFHSKAAKATKRGLPPLILATFVAFCEFAFAFVYLREIRLVILL